MEQKKINMALARKLHRGVKKTAPESKSAQSSLKQHIRMHRELYFGATGKLLQVLSK